MSTTSKYPNTYNLSLKRSVFSMLKAKILTIPAMRSHDDLESLFGITYRSESFPPAVIYLKDNVPGPKVVGGDYLL